MIAEIDTSPDLCPEHIVLNFSQEHHARCAMTRAHAGVHCVTLVIEAPPNTAELTIAW